MTQLGGHGEARTTSERHRFPLETSTQAHLGRKRESLRWSRVTEERFNSFEAATPVPPQRTRPYGEVPQVKRKRIPH
jgi:hypothetical protein